MRHRVSNVIGCVETRSQPFVSSSLPSSPSPPPPPTTRKARKGFVLFLLIKNSHASFVNPFRGVRNSEKKNKKKKKKKLLCCLPPDGGNSPNVQSPFQGCWSSSLSLSLFGERVLDFIIGGGGGRISRCYERGKYRVK